MTESIFQKVAALIAAYKKMPVEEIKPETTFQELGMDSLDALSLVFEIEETFNVTIPDDAAKNIETVGQIVENLENLGVTG